MEGTLASSGVSRHRDAKGSELLIFLSLISVPLCLCWFDILNISCKISHICVQSRSSVAVVALSLPGLLSAHFFLKTPQISSEDT